MTGYGRVGAAEEGFQRAGGCWSREGDMAGINPLSLSEISFGILLLKVPRHLQGPENCHCPAERNPAAAQHGEQKEEKNHGGNIMTKLYKTLGAEAQEERRTQSMETGKNHGGIS
jgi:hypothetical protein